MQICYIHGAGASELSFKWLHQQLPEHHAIFVTYSTDETANSVVNRLFRIINKPTVLVGHSLGGLIATSCAEFSNVSKLVTICAPFGGIQYADFLALFSFEPLIHDIKAHGQFLTTIRNMTITKPHLAIVGSNGLPFMKEKNDGVVTISSQMALIGPQYKTVAINHFEMLLSDTVAKLITDFL